MLNCLDGLPRKGAALGTDGGYFGRDQWRARLRRLCVSGLLSVMVAVPTIASDSGRREEKSMQITSSAFQPGGEIPTQYTCDGADRSPPLSWSDLPAGTETLVLIVDDPDAPDPQAPKMTWVHWVLLNLPAATNRLPEGITALPAGTISGLNDWKQTGYRGPCPPIGRHRYFHKLYALDNRLNLRGSPTKSDVVQAMQGHVLAEAVLMGTYQR
jgi:Raf kinase inhibitor-like YbhB/YbcL family protein